MSWRCVAGVILKHVAWVLDSNVSKQLVPAGCFLWECSAGSASLAARGTQGLVSGSHTGCQHVYTQMLITNTSVVHALSARCLCALPCQQLNHDLGRLRFTAAWIACGCWQQATACTAPPSRDPRCACSASVNKALVWCDHALGPTCDNASFRAFQAACIQGALHARCIRIACKFSKPALFGLATTVACVHALQPASAASARRVTCREHNRLRRCTARSGGGPLAAAILPASI